MARNGLIDEHTRYVAQCYRESVVSIVTAYDTTVKLSDTSVPDAVPLYCSANNERQAHFTARAFGRDPCGKTGTEPAPC